MDNLLGVVLCGGESRRMGSDKGLLLADGKPWSVIATDLLTSLEIPVAISVNGDQIEKYKELFPGNKLVVDDCPIPGPLRGILSTHQHFPKNDLLLLACDMISMRKETLLNLINTYRENPGYDFYVFQHSSFAETLGSIYTSKGLQEVSKRAEANQLHGFSLQSVLNNGNTFREPLISVDDFSNFNTSA